MQGRADFTIQPEKPLPDRILLARKPDDCPRTGDD